jgi:hypothetical protein
VVVNTHVLHAFVYALREGVFGVVGYTAVFFIAEGVGACAYWQRSSTATHAAVAYYNTNESTQRHIKNTLAVPVWQLAAVTVLLSTTALGTEHLLGIQPSRWATCMHV